MLQICLGDVQVPRPCANWSVTLSERTEPLEIKALFKDCVFYGMILGISVRYDPILYSFNWLAIWWILFLLSELQTILYSFAPSYYEFTSRTLDEKYPDNLEQIALAWVKERIEKSNREIKVSKISEVFFRSLNA